MGLGIITKEIWDASKKLSSLKSKSVRQTGEASVRELSVDNGDVSLRYTYNTDPIEKYGYQMRKEIGKGMTKGKLFRSVSAIPQHLIDKVRIKAENDIRLYGKLKTVTSDEALLYDGWFRRDDVSMRKWLRKHPEFRTSEGGV